MNPLLAHGIGVMIVILMLVFIGIWIWAWLPHHDSRFQALARLPMQDDAAPVTDPAASDEDKTP